MLKVGMISLGCARNAVDSEVILGSLKKGGFDIRDVEQGVDICIVNTCAFVRPAREESVNTILEACEWKKSGRIKKLIVCGCLSQLYGQGLAGEFTGVDLVVGTGDFPKIAGLLKDITGDDTRTHVSRESPDYLYDEHSPRFLLTPQHYAYIKISEGCSNFCSYCIISRLRGRFRSRSVASIAAEIKQLSKSGRLKEVNLIGQDTTLFGIDRYGKITFPYLLKKICGLKTGVRWVRILYTHPAHYTSELIETIRGEDKICKYLDLPVQHISDRILKGMNRRTTKKGITELIANLRKKIPGIALRTSIIVGFPGETKKDFEELMRFVRNTRFERLGAFMYSREEGTQASRFGKQVPLKVKKARLDALMKLQKSISRDRNRSFLGREVDVLVDEKVEGEKDRYIGRTEGDAPEVDGMVYVTGRGVEAGKFCRVKITDTLEYDLVGKAV